MSKTTTTNVLPLHEVGEGTRGRGRPKTVERKPTRDDLLYHAKVAQDRRAHVESDELAQAVRLGENPRDVLRRVAESLADEAACLQHERYELQKRGKSIGQVVSRRAALLVELTRLQIKINELDPSVLDLHGEAFARVFRIWLEDLAKVAKETLPPEQFDVLFNKLENTMTGWESRVEAMLR